MPLVRDPLSRLPLAWFVVCEMCLAGAVVFFAIDLERGDRALLGSLAALGVAFLVGGALIDGQFGERPLVRARQVAGLVTVVVLNLVLVVTAALQAAESWDEQLRYGHQAYETLFWLGVVLLSAATLAAVGVTVPVRRRVSIAVLVLTVAAGAGAVGGGAGAVASGGLDSCDRFVFDPARWASATRDRRTDMAFAIERCDVEVARPIRAEVHRLTLDSAWFD
jgi:hypothetical protein